MDKKSSKEGSRKRRTYLKIEDLTGEDGPGKDFNQEYLKRRKSQIVQDSKKKATWRRPK